MRKRSHSDLIPSHLPRTGVRLSGRVVPGTWLGCLLFVAILFLPSFFLGNLISIELDAQPPYPSILANMLVLAIAGALVRVSVNADSWEPLPQSHDQFKTEIAILLCTLTVGAAILEVARDIAQKTDIVDMWQMIGPDLGAGAVAIALGWLTRVLVLEEMIYQQERTRWRLAKVSFSSSTFIFVTYTAYLSGALDFLFIGAGERILGWVAVSIGIGLTLAAACGTVWGLHKSRVLLGLGLRGKFSQDHIHVLLKLTLSGLLFGALWASAELLFHRETQERLEQLCLSEGFCSRDSQPTISNLLILAPSQASPQLPWANASFEILDRERLTSGHFVADLPIPDEILAQICSRAFLIVGAAASETGDPEAEIARARERTTGLYKRFQERIRGSAVCRGTKLRLFAVNFGQYQPVILSNENPNQRRFFVIATDLQEELGESDIVADLVPRMIVDAAQSGQLSDVCFAFYRSASIAEVDLNGSQEPKWRPLTFGTNQNCK